MVKWLDTFKDHHVLVITVNDTAIRKNLRPKEGGDGKVAQIKNVSCYSKTKKHVIGKLFLFFVIFVCIVFGA